MKVCNDYRLLIDLYIDGELDADEAKKVEAHLSVCPACRRYCDEICMVNRAVQDVTIPKDLHASIMAAVSAEMAENDAAVVDFPGQNTQPVKQKRRPARRWIGVVAAMLAVACVGVFGMGNGLAALIPGLGSADEAADANTAVMESESIVAAGNEKSMQDTVQEEVTAEAASEEETEEAPQQLPIRIEEAMTGWFTDAKDHVQVVECGAPTGLDQPEEDGGDNTQNGAEEKLLNDEHLTRLDAMLGEAADGFGFCLVTAGRSTQLPAVFADQAGETAPGFTLVITVRNSDAVRQQIRASMESCGFEVYDDAEQTYFTTDPSAAEGLVIVELTD